MSPILILIELRGKRLISCGDLKMELNPIELGLIPIFVAILLLPLLVQRIERNIEAFLFLMGICAVAISRSWHIGLVEEAAQEPIIVGIVLLVLAAGLVAHYLGPHLLGDMNDTLQDGITMKVIFLEIVVALGLSAIIITPIIPFLLLVEVANHLPITRRMRANLAMLASLSIFLGAALALVETPHSGIAIAKMQGTLPPANVLPLELQSLYIMLCILALGIISTFFVSEKIIATEIRSKGGSALKNIAVWGTRACMFVGAILLVGVAFGVNF
jgi:predicted cation transporter